MIIDTAGDYTIRYTATDECGNSTSVDRSLTVEEPPTYRTVLYTDGTLIINESSLDQAANEQLHGAATNEYVPLNETEKYVFDDEQQVFWRGERNDIISVQFGSSVKATSTAYWFYALVNCTSFNFDGLDTSSVVNMMFMFYNCTSLNSVDVTSFVTNNVTNMQGMFEGCSALETLDLSSFDTQNLELMSSMFIYCSNLKTIYATSAFVTTKVNNGVQVFANMSTSLVGGAGTMWNQYYVNYVRARIDNPPDAPGYFTAKTGA